MKTKDFSGQDWKEVMKQILRFLGTPGIELLNIRLINTQELRIASVIYSVSPPVEQLMSCKIRKVRTKRFVHSQENGLDFQINQFWQKRRFWLAIEDCKVEKSQDRLTRLYIAKFTYPVKK